MELDMETKIEIHPLLGERWSPRAFAPRAVEREKLLKLFEAARWAPSSNNAQPWSFIVATRENPAEHRRLLSVLASGNAQWAQQAPVLVLSIAKLDFDRPGRPNRHAFYDVGQAVANLTVEATSLGLAVHQMAGFDIEQARATFGLPAGCEPVTVIAIGYRGDPETLPEPFRSRERAPRVRKPLEQMLFSGTWGQSHPMVTAPQEAHEI
jgi:nitroreductase